MKKILSAVMMVAVSAGAGYGKATTGIAVFNHSVGARQLGMADAVAGIADDVNAIYYNPAGLATVPTLELNAMYFDNIVDTKDEALSAVMPLRRGIIGSRASVGLGIKAYQGGDIEVLEGTFDGSGNFTLTSERTLNAESDYMGSVAYAEDIGQGICLGAALKGIHSTLVEDYTASAVALDLGILYRTPVQGLSLGLSLLNNGTEMKFIDEGDALPQRTIVGAGYSLYPMRSVKVKLGADHIKEREMDGTTSIGVELGLMNMVMLRGGYYTDSDLGSATMGIGVKLGSIQLDYGYGIMDELGNLQKASLTFRFGMNGNGQEAAFKKRTVKETAVKKSPKKKRVIRRRIIRKKKAAKKHSLEVE